MKILVPVDGSEYSRAAVEFVASRSTLIGTEPQVDVINVQFAVPARAARVVGKAALTEYYTDESDKALKPALRRLAKAGLTATAHYLVGHPGEEISAAAVRDKVDLIVMGSHGHSALRGLLFGSVTNNVLARTACRCWSAPSRDADHRHAEGGHRSRRQQVRSRGRQVRVAPSGIVRRQAGGHVAPCRQ